MKKLVLALAVATMAFGFTSCDKDDEGGAKGDCKECEAFGIETSVCDNGDGTAKVSVTLPGLGESSEDIEIPEGMTFEEFADDQCEGLNLSN